MQLEPEWLPEQDYHEFFSGILEYGLGITTPLDSFFSVAGGDINSCAGLILENKEKVFLKWNERKDIPEDFFKIETQNLAILREAGLPVPQVLGEGLWQSQPYLALRFFDSSNWQDPLCDEWKGKHLASLHFSTQQRDFGLGYDNYIGTLIQKNDWLENGLQFLAENRLFPLAGKAYYDEIISLEMLKGIETICKKIEQRLPKPETASLLHGDFHYNNVLQDYTGRILFIDPSSYYGIREIGLATAELFQGFSPYFYEAYQETFPLPSDWRKFLRLYQLYPLLVHINLFPKQVSYQAFTQSIISQYT